MRCAIPDLVRDIRDPEKPETLEQLDVVYEEGVTVTLLNQDTCLIRIQFIPTVPHCSLATLIGKLVDRVSISIYKMSGAYYVGL